ncbi:MAG TPA: 3-deoxy-8-phosphooctulonate synthase, partial [Candidatus Marinimicrobia bacterium]|nr:3-deoxy-8-phosphooctulonate synthase [Candidatus Neomarinimicrobiota bacterium]
MSKVVEVGRIKIGGGNPLVFIMGPCMIESRDHALRMAEKLKGLAERLGFPLIYKSSYDKANRTSIRSDRGPGLEKGLKVLEEVKREFEVPVLTDLHEPSHAEPVASVVDVLQIPAF